MKEILYCLCVSIFLLSELANAAEQDDKTVSILFAGDIVLDGKPGKYCRKSAEGVFALFHFFAGLAIEHNVACK